jgi:cytochrome c oxidase subunit 3
LIEGKHQEATNGLRLTVALGGYFTALQAIEYYEASFRMADRVYGATFYLATGFHGVHVLVGTAFLRVCALRLRLNHLSPSHHFGFEAAAWYWHFVDVVWLFLYLTIYW